MTVGVFRTPVPAFLIAACLLVGCGDVAHQGQSQPQASSVPAWAQDAIFYQIFPERFRNSDPSNDPTRASLERPLDDVPTSWHVTAWTRDWYEQAGWERQMGGFYDSIFDRRYGGDLQGVIDKLGYLDSLGINAIYFNPLFWARSMHKYDGNTYHHIDPHFGPDPEGDFAQMEQETPKDPTTWHLTAADSLFFALLGKAHERDIRVIIDGVFNHTGRDFFAFRDLAEHQQDSEYADWYVVRSFDDPATPDTNEFDYQGWWGVETLPEFANNEAGTNLHPEVKQYVFDATAKWMDPNGDGDPSDGIDGWRLDVTEEVPIGFWIEWNRYVRALNPEAYTVSEIWQNASDFIEEAGFSATMNYWGFAIPVKAFLIDNGMPPSAFAMTLNNRRMAYEESMRPALQNLIESHDTPRLASMIVNRDPEDLHVEQAGYDRNASPRTYPDYDVTKPDAGERRIQELVALFQMTYAGAPMIYYGTETGLWGADDPDDRKPMLWPNLDYEVETAHPLGLDRPADPVAFDPGLFSFYRDVIALRREHAALRRGDFRILQADDERRLFAYSRTHDGEALAMVLNRSEEAHSTRIPLPEALRGSYTLLFSTTEEDYRVQQDDEALLIEIPELSGLVLQRNE